MNKVKGRAWMILRLFFAAGLLAVLVGAPSSKAQDQRADARSGSDQNRLSNRKIKSRPTRMSAPTQTRLQQDQTPQPMPQAEPHGKNPRKKKSKSLPAKPKNSSTPSMKFWNSTASRPACPSNMKSNAS